jgi:ketosteroid isomerase-like protein
MFATQQEEDSPMRNETTGKLTVMFLLLCCSTCLAQSKPIDSGARRQIDAGNQQWVDAMKQSNAALLAPGNTEDSVDCSPEGNCIRGRTALDGHMKEEMAKLGKADSASVVSIGSVQQGRYVYEWGEAKAHFPNGKSILDRYLTVWQEQPDGTWKVFRNLVIPSR